MFEKRACFCAFHAAPDRVHHAAADRSSALMETKPVGEVQFAGNRGDFEPSVAKLEKSLLEDDTQDLVSQNFRRTLLRESRLQPIAILQSQELLFNRNSWEFKQVQRAVHGVNGEKPRWSARVFDAEQEIRDVGIGDSAQRTAAHSPIERGYAGSGKCAHGLLLSYVGLQCVDGASAHRIHSGPAAIGSKSRAPLR